MAPKKQPRGNGKKAPARPPNPRKPADASASHVVDDSRRQARERRLGPSADAAAERPDPEARETTRDRRHGTREPRLHSR